MSVIAFECKKDSILSVFLLFVHSYLISEGDFIFYFLLFLRNEKQK